MRVLIFTETSGLYGTEQWTASVANRLADRGMHVTIARPSNVAERRALLTAGVTLRDFEVFTHDGPLGWINNRSLAAEIISEERPDVGLVSCGAVVACVGVREELLARDIPYVSVTHLGGQPGFDLPCPAPLRDRVATVLNGAAACVGVSRTVIESLRRDFGLAATAGIAILNGRPDEFFIATTPDERARVRSELGITDDEVMVLTAARVNPNKGYQYQLDAIELLRTRPVWPRLRFVWAGGAEALSRLRALVSMRKLANSVQLLGHRDDVAELLGAADMFVLPSRLEGAPLVIVEAMAKGVAIITTPVNGIPDLVGGCAVLLADPNHDPVTTVHELAHAIESLANDPTRRSELGRAAHQRASELWREEQMVDRYQVLLEDCVR